MNFDEQSAAGYLDVPLERRGTSPQIQDIAKDGINVRKQSRPLSGKLAMASGRLCRSSLHRHPCTPTEHPTPIYFGVYPSKHPADNATRLYTSLHLGQLNLRYDEKSPRDTGNRLIILCQGYPLFLPFFAIFLLSFFFSSVYRLQGCIQNTRSVFDWRQEDVMGEFCTWRLEFLGVP